MGLIGRATRSLIDVTNYCFLMADEGIYSSSPRDVVVVFPQLSQDSKSIPGNQKTGVS